MELNVSYETEHIEVDDVVDVEVLLKYTGLKEETGMAILDVGVPTGFEPVDDSLRVLVEEKEVQRAETAGRKVIFYIESLNQNEVYRFEFQIKALYPVRAEGATATAYEYYDSSVRAYDRLEGVEVGQELVRPSVDRDSVRRPSSRRFVPDGL